MNRRTVLMLASLAMAGLRPAAAAEDHGSRDDAVAMVKRAVDYIKKNGREKAFAAFSDPQGPFIDRDLYVSVFDSNGVNLAHGANRKIIGKDMKEYRDPDGKFPIKMGLEIAKTKGSGWFEFKFLNPVSKQMQDKTAYVERYEDIALWVGAYKD